MKKIKCNNSKQYQIKKKVFQNYFCWILYRNKVSLRSFYVLDIFQQIILLHALLRRNCHIPLITFSLFVLENDNITSTLSFLRKMKNSKHLADLMTLSSVITFWWGEKKKWKTEKKHTIISNDRKNINDNSPKPNSCILIFFITENWFINKKLFLTILFILSTWFNSRKQSF